MFGFVRSAVLVLGLVSLLATSATADSKVLHHTKNVVVDLAADTIDGKFSAKTVAKAAVHVAADVGAPASAALGVIGIAVSPAVVGGAIIVGAGAAVAWGINTLFFDDD